MLRGTRVIEGQEAALFTAMIAEFRSLVIEANYEEIILPALWEPDPWIDRSGPEILNQMWQFQDKGDRQVCLISNGLLLRYTGVVLEQLDV